MGRVTVALDGLRQLADREAGRVAVWVFEALGKSDVKIVRHLVTVAIPFRTRCARGLPEYVLSTSGAIMDAVEQGFESPEVRNVADDSRNRTRVRGRVSVWL
jgi:hypothetical protein